MTNKKPNLKHRYLLHHGSIVLIPGKIEVEPGSPTSGVGTAMMAVAGDRSNPCYVRTSESHRLDVLFPQTRNERYFKVDATGNPINESGDSAEASTWYPPERKQIRSSGDLL